MSAQATLPDEQTAYNTLFGDQLYGTIFFNKLAAAGHPHGGSAERAQAMHKLALHLEALEADNLQKQAASGHDPYINAANMVEQMMGGSTLSKQANDQYRQRLAEQVMQDPGFYNAALTLNVKEAELIKKTLTPSA